MFLVGFMASGKSSIGRELARRLGWDFVDLDALIEAREQQSIADIFRDRGEGGFRSAESSALRHLLNEALLKDSVVALGGGAFAQESNRELLREWPSIFLEAPVSELWQRSLTDNIDRPLRGDLEQFRILYEDRLPFYREATVTIVTSGKDPSSLCSEIQRKLQVWGKNEADASYRVPPSHPQTGESQ